MFAPLSVSVVPVASKVTPLAVAVLELLAITPVTVVLPVPAKVRMRFTEESERLMAPRVSPLLLLFVNVDGPAREWVSVPLNVRAPLPPTVRFWKSMLLLKVRADPSPLIVVPFANVTLPEPKAALFPTTTVPAKRVNPPLKVLFPERVRLPVPALVRVRAPPLSPIAPDNVIAPAEVPTLELAAKVTAPLKLDAPAPELTKAPALEIPVPLIVTASAPIVRPLRSKAAPELTVVPPAVVPNAELSPSFTVPALIVVVPPKVFAPLRFKVLPEEL